MKPRVPSPHKQKGSHLTYRHRCIIEILLKEGVSFRTIADRIGKSPSTISREINRHAVAKNAKGNDCGNTANCTKSHVCGNSKCWRKCHNCLASKNTAPNTNRKSVISCQRSTTSVTAAKS